jgi:hypothetical protein
VQVHQYLSSFISSVIAAAALVWRICLPHRHEEHRFTWQRGLVDVRNSIAGTYTKAEKKPSKKQVHEVRMALAEGSNI